ncbi:MAG TPA: membrane protein insertion efficiency factor YidD [Verrucomicrobiae bacterium]|nr:membrane protein insertion efficiency factor YidD [Verrucomicrobiae bacterium]
MNRVQQARFNLQGRLTVSACRRAAERAGVGVWRIPRFALILAIGFYRRAISPAQIFLFGAGSGCRFTPTCSQYAMEAVSRHGALRGSWLAIRRLCRCHPWGGGGADPVPDVEDGACPAKDRLAACARATESGAV